MGSYELWFALAGTYLLYVAGTTDSLSTALAFGPIGTLCFGSSAALLSRRRGARVIALFTVVVTLFSSTLLGLLQGDSLALTRLALWPLGIYCLYDLWTMDLGEAGGFDGPEDKRAEAKE